MSGESLAEPGVGGSGGAVEVVGAVRAPRPSLQSLLVAAGVASEVELRELAEEARERGVRLGELLLARGLVDEQRLGRLVAGQWRLGFLDREQLTLDPVAAGLLPVAEAREFGGCVVGFRGGGPLVVVAEPTSERLNVLRERLGAAAAGAQVSFAVVSGSSLEALLGQLARFQHADSGPTQEREPALVPVQAVQPLQEAVVPAVSEPEAAPLEANATEAADVEALVADLEQATAGLEVVRGRFEQLRRAGRAREQEAAELRRERDQAAQDAARQQDRVRELELALGRERQRAQAFRQRLSDLLAEFER
jgi:hypothetical protein